MRLFVMAALALCFSANAEKHDGSEVPVVNRDPSSVRAETGKGSDTATEALISELKSSLDELYSVTKGEAPPDTRTGEVKRPGMLWSLPK